MKFKHSFKKSTVNLVLSFFCFAAGCRHTQPKKHTEAGLYLLSYGQAVQSMPITLSESIRSRHPSKKRPAACIELHEEQWGGGYGSLLFEQSSQGIWIASRYDSISKRYSVIGPCNFKINLDQINLELATATPSAVLKTQQNYFNAADMGRTWVYAKDRLGKDSWLLFVGAPSNDSDRWAELIVNLHTAVPRENLNKKKTDDPFEG
jgi:hypothetical protein